jgi:hypothetical protein
MFNCAKLSVPGTTITISRKHVLEKAAKKLGVLIHEFKFTSLGDNDIVTSVIMDVRSSMESGLSSVPKIKNQRVSLR